MIKPTEVMLRAKETIIYLSLELLMHFTIVILKLH